MFSYAHAQSQEQLGAGAWAAEVKPLEIGQPVPDLTPTNLHGYKDIHGKPATTAKLSDFKGKLLILDFWATWCSPCVAMIPMMDSLQKAFGDRVQFLSVTYQNEKEVLPFLEKFEKQRDGHFDIPVMTSDTELTDRYLSYYGNASYTYLKRYIVSASARLDRSNLFGVNANQQGVPLYSAGLAWIANNERFYDLDFLPYLKLRVTYGYNGNVNKSLSAYTTARYSSGNAINQTYATIVNPPNPELRWERVRMINLGIDFATKGNRISGSIEPYYKKGIDLIGDIAYAPSSGITTFRRNTANTQGRGLDISLNSKNINGRFRWETNYLFSYVKDKLMGSPCPQKWTGRRNDPL